MTTRSLVLAIAAAAAVLTAGARAARADLSKEECVDAHSRGQDAKEQGKLSLARKLFLQCAQSSCPSLVQGDCAKFADDLARLEPSVTLAARDASGADLPDTTVYIDDMLVATRLDDGRPHDVDPGKHVVRFTNGGREQTVTVIVSSGEQGRAVVAVFGSPGGGAGGGAAGGVTGTLGLSRAAPREPDKVTVHPLGAKALLYGGAALAVAGAGFSAFELTRVPSACTVGNHECTAAPGDPVFAQAHRAALLADVGMIAGGVGLAAIVGGAIWYVKAGKTETREHLAITPWFPASGAGLAIGGAL